jgi:serine O-acetyltransferase
LELLNEDFETHGRRFTSPGFWALAVHRFGNWRMDVPQKPLRAPLTLTYKVGYECVRMTTGVDLSYVVKVGRRVRIMRPGALMVGAVSVGDDVVFRSFATIGVANRAATSEKPTIGDRVEIGPGACIVGRIRVGDEAVVGANSVIVSNVRPGSVSFGLPAREVDPEDYGRPIASGSVSIAAIAHGEQLPSKTQEDAKPARDPAAQNPGVSSVSIV